MDAAQRITVEVVWHDTLVFQYEPAAELNADDADDADQRRSNGERSARISVSAASACYLAAEKGVLLATSNALRVALLLSQRQKKLVIRVNGLRRIPGRVSIKHF